MRLGAASSLADGWMVGFVPLCSYKGKPHFALVLCKYRL
jgi:hypothetical protein